MSGDLGRFNWNYVSADGMCSGVTSPRKVFVSKVARFFLCMYIGFLIQA
jgi:hypothetical protein